MLAEGRLFPLIYLYSTVSCKKAERLLEETVCVNHTNFHTLILKATCKYMFGGLYSPSCEHVSQNPVVFFAKRPWKEPARTLFSSNLLIIKIGWYVVGLCWLDIPASRRRWPLGTFWWPIELTLLCCPSFLDSSRTFSPLIPINSPPAYKLIKSCNLLFYSLVSLDDSVSSLVLQKGVHLPHCGISLAFSEEELCCETRFVRF